VLGFGTWKQLWTCDRVISEAAINVLGGCTISSVNLVLFSLMQCLQCYICSHYVVILFMTFIELNHLLFEVWMNANLFLFNLTYN